MTRKFPTNDDIDRFFQYGIDISNRTIYMGSLESEDDKGETGTDYAMAEYIIKGLHVLDRKQGNINMILNNPGGDEYHGWAIFDGIKSCKNRVIIKVCGHGMSMGSIILQAGDRRIMTPNSTLMIHYGTWGYSGHALDFLKSAAECKKQCDKMENVFLKRIKEKHPKYNRMRFRREFSFDKYLDAKEALELGLIDKIGYE